MSYRKIISLHKKFIIESVIRKGANCAYTSTDTVPMSIWSCTTKMGGNEIQSTLIREDLEKIFEFIEEVCQYVFSSQYG